MFTIEVIVRILDLKFEYRPNVSNFIVLVYTAPSSNIFYCIYNIFKSIKSTKSQLYRQGYNRFKEKNLNTDL